MNDYFEEDLQAIHDRLKDEGEAYVNEFAAFVEGLKATAERRI